MATNKPEERNVMCMKIKDWPKHPVYFSQKEALQHVKGGDQVGIGFPLAHNVYRVSESKDKEGNAQTILSFQYHYI